MGYTLPGDLRRVRRTALESAPILGVSAVICSLNMNFQSLKKLQKLNARVVLVKVSNSFQEGLKKQEWIGYQEERVLMFYNGVHLANVSIHMKNISRQLLINAKHVLVSPSSQTSAALHVIAPMKNMKLFMSLSMRGTNRDYQLETNSVPYPKIPTCNSPP